MLLCIHNIYGIIRWKFVEVNLSFGGSMNIIVKFLSKSIIEKKFRSFIIIFSVMISAALFFASSGLAGTMSSMYEDLIKMQTGKADLLIFPDRNSPSDTFKIKTDKIDGVAYTVGDLSVGGAYKLSGEESRLSGAKTEKLYIKGFDLEELERLNPVNYSQKAVGRDFTDNCIILSKIFADKHGYEVGDRIEIEIGGIKKILTVWGISRPTGIFQHSPQSDSMMAVMPVDTLASMFNMRGKVHNGYVVLEEGADILTVKDELSNLYSRYVVKEPFTVEEIQDYMQFIVVPLYMMTMMVLFISIFIIYSTFKVITTERLPVIGTFRSIGATKRMTDIVLVGESVAYGTIGGILGVIGGIGVLYLITMIMASDPYNGQLEVSIKFGLIQIISTFILAILVAIVSSWIPISKASKIPIKDLVLNQTEIKTVKKGKKAVIVSLMLLLSFALPFVTPKAVSALMYALSLIVTFAAVIICVPFITTHILKIFENVYGFIFGNIGCIAVKNLKDNKNILNNISLLAIGISVILMINTISYSVGIEVLNGYKDWKFDIMVSLNGDRNAEQVLRSMDGVEGTYGAYESWQGIKVADTDYSIWYLQGIDISRYRDYVAFRLQGRNDYDEVFKKLDEGRYIVIAMMAKESLDVEIGDELVLEMNAGKKTYEVIGFFDSIMQNGSNALISQKYFKSDMNQPYYNRFFVKTSKDPELVLTSIKEKFMRRGVWGDTIRNMERMNYEANNQFMIILKAFSVLAMMIGIFGVFNNYMISFIERKRTIAIQRSVGLSKKQTLKMIFIEALTGGCIGAMVGITGAFMMLWSVPKIMMAIKVPLAIHYKFDLFVISLIGGIIISVIASIGPALRTSKFDIIEAIKYE